VGFGEQDSLFATGNYPITAQAPWDVAKSIANGDCLKFVSTTAGIPALSLLEIRTADKDKYKSYKDLQGQKIGIPGFGTATWGAFATILKSVDGIDAMTYFQPIEADSSTLLALLDQGQIEAAIPFTPVSVIAPQTQPDKYTIIFDMENYFEQQTGQPLLLVGLTARCDWLDANADKVPGVIAGLDDAAQWINDNASTMFADPYYGPILQASGVADQTGADAWAQKLAQHYYFDSSAYTQDWIDSQYKFINDSVGTLIDGAPPPVDQIFDLATIVAPAGSGAPASEAPSGSVAPGY
jgi:ABC-type nitrate/sulfonate/bicarbonate transport system substrate-binding protein